MTPEEKVAVLQERLGQAGENPFEGLFEALGAEFEAAHAGDQEDDELTEEHHRRGRPEGRQLR